MKRLTIAIVALMTVCIFAGGLIAADWPAVNVPPEYRQENWPGSEGMGSCVHASIITLFNWQGKFEIADRWKRNYENGEWPEDMAEKLDREGVRWAATTDGDVSFLEWACRTRRGCGVTVMGGAHMVTLVHLDSKWAAILDNNSISEFVWYSREEFISEWKSSRGWALTPVYSPPAPLPKSPK